MHTSKKLGLIIGYVGLAAPFACNGGTSKSDSSRGAASGAGGSTSGASSTDGGGSGPAADAAPPPVRTSCGNVPITTGDYAPSDIPATCKACIDTQCCDLGTACAGDPACAKWRECWANCTGAAPCDCGAAPKTSTDLQKCSNSCDACQDLSCTKAPWPVPAPETFTASMTVSNFLTGAPQAGVRVRACAMTDTECTSPLDEAVVDASGAIAIKLPSGPLGTSAYLEFTGADIGPALWFPDFFDGKNVLETGGLRLGLLDSGTAHALWGGLGATADPSKDGFVSVNLHTCGFSGISGASVTATGTDSATIITYFQDGLPAAGATSTDSSGLADFIGVAPGPITVTAAKGGAKLGSRSVFVRAGFNSVVSLPPEP